MAELVDAADLKSADGNVVGVQVPLPPLPLGTVDMPSRRDSYLTRVNRALKDLGCEVAIEVSPCGRSLRIRDHAAPARRLLDATAHQYPYRLSRRAGAGPQAC